MKKICFHIQKGGVGKTTVCGNTAAQFAADGKRTLLVDFDPQGNLTSWLHPTGADAKDIADALTGAAELQEAIVPVSENLWLLPVKSEGGNLKAWSETDLVRNPRAIEFLVGDLEALGYEYAVFDCSPSFSLLERSAIAASDEVVVPLTPEFFSIDGVERFERELRNIEKANRTNIVSDKIVVNLLNRSFTRHKVFLEELQKLPYRIFIIPQDSKTAESQIARTSLINFDRSAKAVPYFEELARALL
jgi:cellulose biosynthesis protein BcsQ